MPFSIEHARDEACGQANHRHVGLPMQVKASAQTCESEQAADDTQDRVSGFRPEEPNNAGPEDDQASDLQGEYDSVRHGSPQGADAMNDTIDEDPRLRQPVAGDNPAIWAELPSFVELGDDYIDGWKPAPAIGDDDLDTLMGEFYADIAVKHAREIKDPGFVWFVMAAIYFKTARGLIVMGATEQGFLNRLARLAYVGSLN
jgi:hypothetical protein